MFCWRRYDFQRLQSGGFSKSKGVARNTAVLSSDKLIVHTTLITEIYFIFVCKSFMSMSVFSLALNVHSRLRFTAWIRLLHKSIFRGKANGGSTFHRNILKLPPEYSASRKNIVHSHPHENFKSPTFSLLRIREKNNKFSEHNPSTLFLFEIKIREGGYRPESWSVY
jgi:hypothetical protein